MDFEIIETDAGMTVADLASWETPEEAAIRQGGAVVDPGPYKSYDDAYDGILALQAEEEDESQ